MTAESVLLFSIAEFIRNGSIAQYQGFPDNLDPLHDKDGHGTHGASVLLKTTPHATLLVARVNDDLDYTVTIKNLLQFHLVINYIGIGPSFRQVRNIVNITNHNANLSKSDPWTMQPMLD